MVCLKKHICGDIVRHHVILILLVYIEKLLILRWDDGKVMMCQMTKERLIHLLHLEHINRHGWICKFQTIHIRYLQLLQLLDTCVNTHDKAFLLLGDIRLVEIEKCIVVVLFQIVVATVGVPLRLLRKESVEVFFHKPHTFECIRIVTEYAQLHQRHITYVHVQVNLPWQETVGYKERMRIELHIDKFCRLFWRALAHLGA